MMTAIAARSVEIEAQVEAYRAALLAAGMYADHPVGSVARAWLKRVGVDGWHVWTWRSSAPRRCQSAAWSAG
jgi:hypothetical protein